jgi:hypothetical protein
MVDKNQKLNLDKRKELEQRLDHLLLNMYFSQVMTFRALASIGCFSKFCAKNLADECSVSDSHEQVALRHPGLVYGLAPLIFRVVFQFHFSAAY